MIMPLINHGFMRYRIYKQPNSPVPRFQINAQIMAPVTAILEHDLAYVYGVLT